MIEIIVGSHHQPRTYRRKYQLSLLIDHLYPELRTLDSSCCSTSIRNRQVKCKERPRDVVLAKLGTRQIRTGKSRAW